MKASELRHKTVDELNGMLTVTRRHQFKLRLQKMSSDFKNKSEFKTARRNIARILTVLAEMNKDKGKAS